MFLNLLFLTLGLTFGSFFAALSWRYPRGISVAKGRSICPKCKHEIAWYDNIPVFSFIVLGGKCRNCKKSISFRYPLIEFSTAIGFLYFSIFFQNNIFNLLYFLVILSILILIFIIDWEHKIIPDDFTFLGVAIAILFLLLTDYRLIFASILAGFTSAFLLLLINLLTKGRGMGLGDVKFAILGGMLVGPKLNIIWLFFAFLTGGMVGIILILLKRAGLKDQIAFGPFLVISIGLAIIFGDKLLILMGLR
ncbi:MAG TPA: prepilin peptidase [Patescibacteria group bacterium]|nr:prepilin peptidase [Patescibacteria group bacterium]